MSDPVRIAVPTKGRLQEPSALLLKQAGLRFERSERSLSVPVADTPFELLFVRTEDVPELVADGVAALGITGLDLVEEADLRVEVSASLGFGRCRLVAAVPEMDPAEGLSDLDGYRLATSHPRTVRRFFDAKGLQVDTIPLRGSVEVAPRLDVAGAVVDLVSTGSTMRFNGLRPVATLLESEAVLVTGDIDRNGDVRTLTTMIRSVVTARRKRYVMMNAPSGAIDVIAGIIPGIEAPTVVPLDRGDMVAVHSVVEAGEVWRVLPRLEEAGATGILVLPIEQMIA
jgi:ATP phosphoribosyltransferase